MIGGVIVKAGGKPVEGVKILFGQPEGGLSFVDGATATTDARGRYRADLSRFPWSSAATRAMALAPGYKAVDRIVEAGTAAATAEFTLEAQPWKETLIRLEDASGRPAAGVEILCDVCGADWPALKTDTEGRCRVAMAPAMAIHLSARPEGARPIEITLLGTDDEPAVITLPVLPPIRGRVRDERGRPAKDVAVGRWVVLESGGVGEMLPLPDGATAVTDRDGNFAFAPKFSLHDAASASSWSRWHESLCFADPSFRRIASRSFNPTLSIEPMEVHLAPTRRVRVPIERGPVPRKPADDLSSGFSIKDGVGDTATLVVRYSMEKKPGDSPTGELAVEEYLPEGAYRLEVTLRDPAARETIGEATRDLVVPPGEGPLDLPPLTLESPYFRVMAGKPAPEIEAADLDTGRPVTLVDFLGKVVVLEFWGHWCGPCIWSLPDLAGLQRKFEGRPLVVVALHDRSAQSRAEYDRKTAFARERIWGGRDLPLRVLLDRPDPQKAEDRDPIGTGATIKRYAVTSFPTLVVIDHEGRLIDRVRRTQKDRLEALVRTLVEKAEGR